MTCGGEPDTFRIDRPTRRASNQLPASATQRILALVRQTSLDQRVEKGRCFVHIADFAAELLKLGASVSFVAKDNVVYVLGQ
jgi:hypothetical protein